MEHIELPTVEGSLRMPMLGLGTFLVDDSQVFDEALKLGYPLLDTAVSYGNEDAIGDSLKKHHKTHDTFVTSKLPGVYMGKYTRQGVERSLRDLKVDCIDLYLIHGPCGMKYCDEETMFPTDPEGNFLLANHDILQTWRELEQCVEDGLIKAIGVSNFNEKQVARLVEKARVPVANNQVEIHAYMSQERLAKFCWDKDVTVTGYAPLGSPAAFIPGRCSDLNKWSLLGDPVVTDIASKHDRTPAQVLLRHTTQRGIAVVPKASSPHRLQENLQALEFKLDEVDMERLKGLNIDKRTFTIDIWQDHPEYPFEKPI